MRLLFFYLLFLFLLPGCAGPVKRALKAIEKNRFGRADRILDKRIKKDTLSPGAYYAYSLLFSCNDYPAYNIDSSRFYILKALDQYPAAGKRKVKKLQRQDINDSLFWAQKLRIDSLGFARAYRENSIAAYQYFIDHFPTAPQLEKAKEIRNNIAYQHALSINTYEAYKDFLDAYPDARQITEANEMYEFLLYENKTRDRKLSSYVNFLKNHPQTNYTGDAQKNIFEISTAGNRPEHYVYFVKTYPQNPYVKQAIDFLYHIIKEEKNTAAFFSTYGDLPLSDSLKAIAALEEQVLWPVYEAGRYGFMNQQGDMVIPPVYRAIPEGYYCGNIRSDLLVTGKGEDEQVIARNNLPVITRPVGSLKDLGYGMVRLSSGNAFGMIHKSGYPVLDPEYEWIELLGHEFIKYKQGGKWGLKSFTGKDLLHPEYDDIYQEGDFIIVEKYGLLAVTHAGRLAAWANGEEVNLKFQYDEVAQASNDAYLLAYYKAREAVLDTTLRVIIPLDEHKLALLKEGWLIKKGQQYFVYNEAFVPYTYATLDSALFNDYWLALKRAGRWTLLEQEGNLFPDFRYDSVSLLSNAIALTFAGDSTVAHFSTGATVLLPRQVSIRLLNQFSQAYLLTENRNGYKQVYNPWGKPVISGSYHSVSIIGPGLISLERNGKKGLADTTGQTVLPFLYSGIGNYEEGDVALLRDGKFGLYNRQRDIFIRPEYDIILRPYGGKFYVASKNNKRGLIDWNNKTVAPFQFDDIRPWSDSLALVQQGREWRIYNYYENRTVYGPFIDFKYVKESDEENVLIILDASRYGVLSSKTGEVLPPVYNDLLNLGSTEDPVYYTETKVEEAIFFVITYFDAGGRKIRQQAMANEDYEVIYCE